MVERLIPSWNICVLTMHSGASELSNALLYGDKVIWLPEDVLYLLSLKHIAVSFEENLAKYLETSLADAKQRDKYLAKRILDGVFKQYRLIADDIDKGQLPIIAPKHFMPRFKLPDLQGYEQLNVDRTKIVEATNKIVEFMEEEGRMIQTASACILAPGCSTRLEMSSHWDTGKAAQLLMTTLSQVFFPDVSSLPLLEVAELREKVKDELNPMRAEMLRLTEDLRQMVKDKALKRKQLRKRRISSEPVSNRLSVKLISTSETN